MCVRPEAVTSRRVAQLSSSAGLENLELIDHCAVASADADDDSAPLSRTESQQRLRLLALKCLGALLALLNFVYLPISQLILGVLGWYARLPPRRFPRRQIAGLSACVKLRASLLVLSCRLRS